MFLNRGKHFELHYRNVCIFFKTFFCSSEGVKVIFQELCDSFICFLICFLGRSKVVKVCFKRKRFFVQIRPDWVKIVLFFIHIQYSAPSTNNFANARSFQTLMTVSYSCLPLEAFQGIIARLCPPWLFCSGLSDVESVLCFTSLFPLCKPNWFNHCAKSLLVLRCSYQTAVLHHFGKCSTIISLRVPNGAKKEKKTITKRT